MSWKHRAFKIECPKCGAPVGRHCHKPNGEFRKSFHTERHSEAKRFMVIKASEPAKPRRYNKSWAILRAKVFSEKGCDCVYCGAPASHVDHQTPVSRGGSSDMDNLVPSCDACNIAKGSKTLQEWRP